MFSFVFAREWQKTAFLDVFSISGVTPSFWKVLISNRSRQKGIIMEIPCAQESQATIIQAFGQAVELEYSGQNSSQTPPKCSNIQKLGSILKRFLNITVVGKNQQKIFIEDLLKYMELIMIFLSSDMEYRKQRNYESIYMSFIPGIFKTIDFKNVFVQQATVKTLALFMYGDFSFVSKKSLLTIFNEIALDSEKRVRNEVAKETLNIMFNLLDCLETHGDFVLQSDILETFFRIFGQQIRNNTFELLPGSKDLGKALLDIASVNDFDGNARIWLNKFNQDSPNIFSIACKTIMLGNDVCRPPKDMDMWLDFNMKESMLSFYCDSWNRLIILAKDVKKAEVKRVLGASETTVSIEMTRPCISEQGGNQKHFDKCEKHLKLVIGNEDKEKVAKLMTIVLPQMFGETFSRLSSRISTKLKNVYKPLPIKVSRPKSGSSEVSIRTTSSRSATRSDTRSDTTNVELNLSKERISVRSSTDGALVYDPEKYSHGRYLLADKEDATITDFTILSCLSPTLDDVSNITSVKSSTVADVTEKYSKGRILADNDERNSRKSSTSVVFAPVTEKYSKGHTMLRVLADNQARNSVESPTSVVFAPVTEKYSKGRNMRNLLADNEDATVTDFTRLSCASPAVDVLDILPSREPKLQDNIISSSHGDGEASSSPHSKIEILSGRCSARSADYQRFVREGSAFNPSELLSSSPIIFSSTKKNVADVSSEFSGASGDREIRKIMSNFFTEDLDEDDRQNAKKDTVESQEEVLGESDSLAIFSPAQVDLPRANQNTEESTNNFSLAVNVGISENQYSDCPYAEKTILKHSVDVLVNHGAPNMEVESVKKEPDANNVNLEGGRSKRSKLLMEANKENIIDLTIDDVEQETNEIKKIISSNANKDNFEKALPKTKYSFNTPQLLVCLEDDIPLKETAHKNTKPKDEKVNNLNKAEIGEKPKTKKGKSRTLIKTGKKRFNLEKPKKSTESNSNANRSKELQTARCLEVSFKENTSQKTDGLEICEKTKENDEQVYEKTEKYGEQTCEKAKHNLKQIFEKAKENQAVEEDTPEVSQKKPLKECIHQLAVVLTTINIEQRYDNSSPSQSQLAPEIISENVDYSEAFAELKKSKDGNKSANAIQNNGEAVASDKLPDGFQKEQMKQLNVVLTKMNVDQKSENSPEIFNENDGYVEAFDEPNKSDEKNRLANAIQNNVEAVASESSVRQTTEYIERNSHASEAEMASKINTEHVDDEDDIPLSQFVLKKVARQLPETQEEVSDHHKKDTKTSNKMKTSKKGKGRKTAEVKSSDNDCQPESIDGDVDMAELPIRKGLAITSYTSRRVRQKLVITPNTSPTVGQEFDITVGTSPEIRQPLVMTADHHSPELIPKVDITPDSSPDVGPQIIATIAQVHWPREKPGNEAMDRSQGSNESLSQELEALCMPKKTRKRQKINWDEIVEYTSPVLKKRRSSERLNTNQSPDDFEKLCQTAVVKSKINTTTSGNRSRKLFTEPSYLDDLPAIAEQKTPDSGNTPISFTTGAKPKKNTRVAKKNRKSAEKQKAVGEKPARKAKKSPKEKSAQQESKPRKTRTKTGRRKKSDFCLTKFETLNELFNQTHLTLQNGDGFGRWNKPQMDIVVRSAPICLSSDDSPLSLVEKSTRDRKNDSPKLLSDVPKTPPTPIFNSSDLEIEPYNKAEETQVQKKINIQQHIIIPPKRPLQILDSNEDGKRRKVESVALPNDLNVPIEKPAVVDNEAEPTVAKGIELLKFIITLIEANSTESSRRINALYKQMELPCSCYK